MIVAVVVLDTGVVATPNVVVLAPAGTTIVAGTSAAVLSVDTVTAKPADGAGPVSVSVAVTLPPPRMVAGAMLRPAGAGGATVSAAICVAPPADAEIRVVVEAATGVEVIDTLTLD